MVNSVSESVETFQILAIVFVIFAVYCLTKFHLLKMGYTFAFAAVVVSFLMSAIDYSDLINGYGYLVLVLSVVIGVIIGVVMGIKNKTFHPQRKLMLLNSFGSVSVGICCIGIYVDPADNYYLNINKEKLLLFFITLSIIFGFVNFCGSTIIYFRINHHAKMENGNIKQAETDKEKEKESKQGKTMANIIRNIFMVVVVIAICFFLILSITTNISSGLKYILMVFVLSSILGITFFVTVYHKYITSSYLILNSLTGLHCITLGFVISHNFLIAAGSFICGTSLITFFKNCQKNEIQIVDFLFNNLFEKKEGDDYEGNDEDNDEEINIIPLSQLKNLILNNKKILIAPGYGLVVSQAQHVLSEFLKLLANFKINATIAINPIAGRCPNQILELLNDAQVPFSAVSDLNTCNSKMAKYGLVLVLGGNDIINSEFVEDPDSNFQGVPVLKVWNAKNVVVIKKGSAKGYNKRRNPTFKKRNVKLFLGDIKEIITILNKELKGLRRKIEDEIKERKMNKEIKKTHIRPSKSLEKHQILSESEESSGLGTGSELELELENTLNKKLNEKNKNIHIDTDTGTEIASEEIKISKVDLVEKYKTIGFVFEDLEEEKILISIIPTLIKRYHSLGFNILIHSEIESHINYSQNDYQNSGAQMLSNVEEIWDGSDIIIKFLPPNLQDVNYSHEKQIVFCYFSFIRNKQLIQAINEKKLTLLSIEDLPNILQTQSFNPNLSLNRIVGYRAVIEAATHFEKFFLGEVTAAGKYPPATVLIIGSDDKAISALKCAKGLGAKVLVFDFDLESRPVVEYLGGEFILPSSLKMKDPNKIELTKRHLHYFKRLFKKANIVITTMLDRGNQQPLKLPEELFKYLKEGSVVVDLNANMGGNCAITKAGEIVNYNGVTVIGITNYLSKMNILSSQMYSSNLFQIIQYMLQSPLLTEDDHPSAQDFVVDKDNQIINAMCIFYNGKPTKSFNNNNNNNIMDHFSKKLESQSEFESGIERIIEKKKEIQILKKQKIEEKIQKSKKKKFSLFSILKKTLFFAAIITLVVLTGTYSNHQFLTHAMVLVLASVIGLTLVNNIPQFLINIFFTTTNAISGIIIIGAIYLLRDLKASSILISIFALLLTSINISNGFFNSFKLINQ
ncbi:nicotinamide nucleotide transhydrogenase [Anaeramoeba flamelloides]|uniref:proton-translocating NAD(P)(+) transhydrogenase n=1 Tax=Anaeramoeba flamelloides TaxID=1746091 RepID=A0ABQ8YUX0_9EUKA|nr:nicotinamide nucleotide transhydrogenase [Anaeramoeba flamelloides]